MKRIFAGVITLLSCGLSFVTAHPHVAIDVILEPVTANGLLDGVQVTWLFELHAYTMEIFDNYDRDSDGNLNADEIENIKDRAFDNLIEHDYFLRLRSGDVDIEPRDVKRFSAVLTEKSMEYHFYLPYDFRYETSPNSRLKKLMFTIQDPTGFVTLNLKEFRPPADETRGASFIVAERLEQFTFRHDRRYDSEMLVYDIRFYPSRS